MPAHSPTAKNTSAPGLACAISTFATLGKFVSHLRESAERYGTAIVPSKADPDQIPEIGYDLDVAGIALATAARIFDFDCNVIALIEDAQFRGCPVHICRARGGAPVMTAANRGRSNSDTQVNGTLSAPICPTCANSYDPPRYDSCEERAWCANCGTPYRIPDRFRPPEDQLENGSVDQVPAWQAQGR